MQVDVARFTLAAGKSDLPAVYTLVCRSLHQERAVLAIHGVDQHEHGTFAGWGIEGKRFLDRWPVISA